MNGERKHKALTFGALSALSLGFAPEAFGSEPQCHTSRSADDILWTEQSPHLFDTPQVAVDVRRGETLCISGTPAEDGTLHTLALAPEVEQALFVVSIVELPGDLTALVVRNRGTSRLTVRTLRSSGPGPSLDSLAPGQQGIQLFPSPVERVVLFGIETQRQPPRSPPPTPLPPPPPPTRGLDLVREHGTWWGLWGRFVIGTQRFDLAALNAELNRSGYQSADRVVHPLGGTLGSVFGPWRLSLTVVGDKQTVRGPENASADVDTLSIGLDLAYELSPLSLTRFHPFIGIHSANIAIDASGPLFAEQVGFYEQPSEVSFSQSLMHVGYAFEQSIPFAQTQRTFFELLLGLNAGYALPVASGDWSIAYGTDENPQYAHLSGGPDISLGGPFVFVTAGLGFRKAKPE